MTPKKKRKERKSSSYSIILKPKFKGKTNRIFVANHLQSPRLKSSHRKIPIIIRRYLIPVMYSQKQKMVRIRQTSVDGPVQLRVTNHRVLQSGPSTSSLALLLPVQCYRTYRSILTHSYHTPHVESVDPSCSYHNDRACWSGINRFNTIPRSGDGCVNERRFPDNIADMVLVAVYRIIIGP